VILTVLDSFYRTALTGFKFFEPVRDRPDIFVGIDLCNGAHGLVGSDWPSQRPLRQGKVLED